MWFYEQVWSVWWLRYSKKLTCNNFEVSDFLNFEKIWKIRWKTQKRVIFTKMLFSLRRVKTALINFIHFCTTRKYFIASRFWNFQCLIWCTNSGCEFPDNINEIFIYTLLVLILRCCYSLSSFYFDRKIISMSISSKYQ